MGWRERARLVGAGALLLAVACSSGDSRTRQVNSESCMSCHNASPEDDYMGPGIENPHPFAGADQLRCTTCHGGNPAGHDKLTSHVPPPPQIGDREHLEHDRKAYFNRLTLTGIDKLPDYQANGRTWSALDYLQFVNPGDLRVVTEGRACGQCHAGHAECVGNGLLATSTGILSGAMYAIGVDNAIPENEGLYQDTAADLAFRAVSDPAFDGGSAPTGAVASLLEFPVFSVRDRNGPNDLFRNDLYNALDLPNDQLADNRVVTGSRLANLYHEQIAFTCGDCHLGSAGANNRYGDFRSSGCTACHMPYSLDGRSRSRDPNVRKDEPADPDDIDAPERSHVRKHEIRSVAQRLPDGRFVPGIDDYACAGCHQGSNRTVMQYWGIRLDQNADVHRGFQYPAQPTDHEDTRDDVRLFDPGVGNHTFNGRQARQYLRYEDYDDDDRDDTPADVHYQAGLGCIDCHGSYDLHGGDVADPHRGRIPSRMEQGVAIRCESCHGSVDAYAATVVGTNYDGEEVELAVDSEGNPLRHVEREADGHFYLTSRLTGRRHYVVQTRDTVVDSGRTNPVTGDELYSVKASYAMGRDDGDPSTGIGPQQTASAPTHFSHADDVSCVACHASWTNSCIGCHLGGEYREGNDFSNITGDQIVFRQANADFVYQSPVPFQLGVGPDGKIQPISPNTDAFFQYEDRLERDSKVFAFTDRNGGGANPAAGHPSLSHNAMMPHSIRGRVDDENEGPRYCVACHLTTDGLATWGAEYDTLRTAMQSPTFDGLDPAFFDVLAEHIGKNSGNQKGSPLWVHMVAGLGSGLFLFDENGCPVNSLDDDPERVGCEGAPSAAFDLTRVRYNLDRIVDENGVSTGSNTHPMDPGGSGLRDGSTNPGLAGPLGMSLVRRLTDPNPAAGVVLDAWIDADGELHGDPSNFD